MLQDDTAFWYVRRNPPWLLMVASECWEQFEDCNANRALISHLFHISFLSLSWVFFALFLVGNLLASSLRGRSVLSSLSSSRRMSCGGVEFRRSTILPWIFTLNKWVRGQQVWVRKRGRQYHRRSERELVLVFSLLWGARWDMTRGWTTCFGDAPQSWAKRTSRLCTVQWLCMWKMWRATCVCLHTPSIAKEFSFQQAKKCISEQKMTTVGSMLRTAKNSNFCLPERCVRKDMIDDTRASMKKPLTNAFAVVRLCTHPLVAPPRLKTRMPLNLHWSWPTARWPSKWATTHELLWTKHRYQWHRREPWVDMKPCSHSATLPPHPTIGFRVKSERSALFFLVFCYSLGIGTTAVSGDSWDSVDFLLRHDKQVSSGLQTLPSQSYSPARARRSWSRSEDFVCISDMNSRLFACCMHLWDITAGCPRDLLTFGPMKMCLPRPTLRLLRSHLLTHQ